MFAALLLSEVACGFLAPLAVLEADRFRLLDCHFLLLFGNLRTLNPISLREDFH